MNKEPITFTSPDDTDLLSLVVGFILPPFIALIQQPKWPNWFRSLVTLFVCILVGGLESYLQGELAAGSILRRVLVVAISANATYQGFWKHAGARGIENATSPKKAESKPAP